MRYSVLRHYPIPNVKSYDYGDNKNNRASADLSGEQSLGPARTRHFLSEQSQSVEEIF